jgi:anti-anti-sigma factor
VSVHESSSKDLGVGRREAQPRVEREALSLRVSIVTLSGEHDARMQQPVLEELSRTTYFPRLIVDLTPCTFIDSSMIATLLNCRRSGSRPVELVVPDDGGRVSRTISLARVDTLVHVHGTLDVALRSEPSIPWS